VRRVTGEDEVAIFGRQWQGKQLLCSASSPGLPFLKPANLLAASRGILHASIIPKWCTRARPRANVTAKWGMCRRTGTTYGVGDHVINLGATVRDPMMLGRGRCREGGAENNRSGKRNFCLAQHFRISALRLNPKLAGGIRPTQDETTAGFAPTENAPARQGCGGAVLRSMRGRVALLRVSDQRGERTLVPIV
jgi:hypothetical protein